MKFFVVIFAIISVTYAQSEQFREQCKNELDIQQDTIEKFKRGQYDEHVPCFTECVFRKMGVFADGNFDVDALMRYLRSDTKSPDELRTEIENCIDKSESDACQRAFKGFTCFKQAGLYKMGRPRS